MSILIKGMKMPKSCWECQCEIVYPSYGRSVCGITSQFTINNRDTRREDCPLIELPPHGRLIDADALPWDDPVYSVRLHGGEQWMSAYKIATAPTIIEAEEVHDGTL